MLIDELLGDRPWTKLRAKVAWKGLVRKRDSVGLRLEDRGTCWLCGPDKTIHCSLGPDQKTEPLGHSTWASRDARSRVDERTPFLPNFHKMHQAPSHIKTPFCSSEVGVKSKRMNNCLKKWNHPKPLLHQLCLGGELCIEQRLWRGKVSIIHNCSIIRWQGSVAPSTQWGRICHKTQMN